MGGGCGMGGCAADGACRDPKQVALRTDGPVLVGTVVQQPDGEVGLLKEPERYEPAPKLW